MMTHSLAELRRDAREIFNAALRAADPQEAVRCHARCENGSLVIAGERWDLSQYHHVFVVGVGKAAAGMTRAVEELLGDKISDGIAVVKYGHSLPLRIVKIAEAGHPVPDKAGVDAATLVFEILGRAGKEDLVLFLVSGGGSALLACPAEGLTLAEKQETTEILLKCGAKIQEINTVRKHISKTKGGRLVQAAYPATSIALILSDVIGDSLESIASGPTVPDTTEFSDCLQILQRHEIETKIPPAVRAYLERGANREVEETPKPSHPVFQKVRNVIVGSNRLALEAGKQRSDALGYKSIVLSSFVEGETKTVATVHAAIAREIVATGNPVTLPACVLSGGETTVTVRGAGLGGRNQEFALAAAMGIDGMDGVVILSGGTDGTDGPTDAAGAIVDGKTLTRARAAGLDAESFLRNNDSYHFLQSTGDLLITGPTYTNVMDLHVVLVA